MMPRSARSDADRNRPVSEPERPPLPPLRGAAGPAPTLAKVPEIPASKELSSWLVLGGGVEESIEEE